MTSYNVTPITPVGLPYTYTSNFGQAYEFASVSKQGCVDTVYADTYNGVAYIPGLPVSPSTAIQLVGQANAQFGPLFQVCQSLVNQVQYSGSGVNLQNLDFFDVTGNWLIDDVLLVGIVFVLIGVFVWLGKELGIIKKR
jgi:hypothetical protein